MDETGTQVEPKQGKLAMLLGSAKKNRNHIVLEAEDENGNSKDIGIAVNYDAFDGNTKLNYDNRVDRALILRGNKQVVALQEALAWLFEVKLKDIEGLDKDVDCGGVEPKQFFLTDPDGIILMRTATNEYLRRNRVTVGDSKN